MRIFNEGFTRCVLPARNMVEADGIELVGVETLGQALDCLLQR